MKKQTCDMKKAKTDNQEPTEFIDMKKPSKTKLFVKRAFDIASSGAVILLLLPFFIFFTPIVAIIMRGNPFFVQKRVGKDEKIFRLVKYRTMTNAKDKEGNLLPDAERLSRFGNIMRKLSVDELPELFNIFFGQMSVVGPRPLQPVYLPFYTAEQARRHIVRPGLTGLAQIRGRNSTPWDIRLGYDIEYIERLSFPRDLKIIFATIAKVVKSSDVGVMGDEKSVGHFYEDENCKTVEYREIGSAFVFGNEDEGNGLHIKTDKANITFFDLGRSAIGAVIEAANAKIAYLPSFTCESVIRPFVNTGVEIKFYQVDKNLNIDKAFLKNVKQEKEHVVVFLQSYFGKYNLDGVKTKLHGIKHVTVVEDITHAMLNDIKFVNADFYLASIRKWGGFGECGIVVSDESLRDYAIADASVCDELQSAAELQREYYLNGDKDIKVKFREKLGDIETQFDGYIEPHTVDVRVKDAIESSDFETIKCARRRNYYALNNMLKEFGFIRPVFDELKKTETPLYFPFYCDVRDDLQHYLAEKQIYCPIIWPCSEWTDGCRSETVDEIYAEILCFPIDQRYGLDDMKRIFYAVEEYKNEKLS